jgi:hypothetical protein
MKKKYGIVLACILCVLLLAGFLGADAKIITWNGEPLIDLDELIHSTETGQEGSTDDGAYVTPAPKPGIGDDDPNNPNPPKTDTVETDGKYVIEIYNNEIRCGGLSFIYDKDTNSLKERAIQALDGAFKDVEGKEIVIVGDYAEAHTMRFMVAYLNERFAEPPVIKYEPEFDKNWGVSR